MVAASGIESSSLNTVYSYLRLAFVAEQTPIEAAKVIPPLQPSDQGKCRTLNAGQQVLNAVFCMIPVETFEAVGMRVCTSDETRAGRACSRFLKRQFHPVGKLADH